MIESSHTYPAHAFHDQFNKGRASGHINVAQHSIEFIAEGDRVRMPTEGLQVKLGGASNRLVFFTHPNYPDWNIYTSDRSILENPLLRLNDSLQNKLRKARNTRRTGWAVLVMVVFCIVAIPVSILANMDTLTEVVAEQVPPEWEEELGKSAFAQYKIENTIFESESAEAAINELTGPLLDAVDDDRYQYQVYIADSPDLNAFALPGGYIVLNSGLILASDNAEQVLGVLAHEIAHVTEQHGIRNIIGAAGTYAIIQAFFGDVSGILATVVNAAPLLINQSYSRGFESEADEKGLVLLEKANISPIGLIQFFDKIKAKEKEMLANFEDEETKELVQDALGFLSTHPATEERIEDLREQINQKKENGGFLDLSYEFSNLKQIVQGMVSKESS